MTCGSVPQTNSKTAEFARLFDLFDRVASRRARALNGDTGEPISADDIANVPAEFAPVLKNLSTILSSRAIRHEGPTQHAETASMTRTRHASLACVPSMTLAPDENSMPHVDRTQPSDEIEEDLENLSFPLDERYPFTFKLMLHKLYGDEWAEKVKSALETSKSQFKPLAERVQKVVREGTASIEERSEDRSDVRPVMGSSAKFKPLPTATRNPGPQSGTMPFKPETSRVLKKRCVGRRKSESGPLSSGVWVYDAAVSATEVASPRRATEITLSTAPRPDGGGVVENCARGQSLAAVEEKPKTKVVIPVQVQEVSESVTTKSPSISAAERGQGIVETARVVTKSMVSTFASEPCKRVAVKRPLCT